MGSSTVPNVAPTAAFTHLETALQSAFTDTSSDTDGSIVAWDWDFGDGSAHGTTQSPSRTYATSGTYTVTLIVTDNGGLTGTVSHAVTVDSRAVLTATLLTGGTSTTDGTSIATASITPVANRVVYAAVSARAVSNVVTPTCTGNGLTWVLIDTAGNPSATPTSRLTVFRAQGASPTTGAITFDFGAETQTSFGYEIVQFTNAVTSGTNGSGATVQSVKTQNAGTAASVVTTLAALENAANAALVFVATGNNNAMTKDAAFTELGQNSVSSNAQRIEAQWALNQTVCTTTFTSQNACAIAIEVKAASV